MRLIAYPMARENMTQALDEVDYVSPRLRDLSLWALGNEEMDYVFIKVYEPLRPDAARGFVAQIGLRVSFPFPRRPQPTASVTGMPIAV